MSRQREYWRRKVETAAREYTRASWLLGPSIWLGLLGALYIRWNAVETAGWRRLQFGVNLVFVLLGVLFLVAVWLHRRRERSWLVSHTRRFSSERIKRELAKNAVKTGPWTLKVWIGLSLFQAVWIFTRFVMTPSRRILHGVLSLAWLLLLVFWVAVWRLPRRSRQDNRGAG